jgi:hypothetical protein
MGGMALLTQALQALAEGDEPRAIRYAEQAEGLVGPALARYLGGERERSVYEAPAAFQAFVDGGGNVGLYEAVVPYLAARYADVETVLDLGSGDGRAVLPAAKAAARSPRLDLVEPSDKLRQGAAQRASDLGLDPRIHACTAQEFAAEIKGESWDLAQSTFAITAIPTEDAMPVLTRLRPHVRGIVIIEFDIPAFEYGSDEHLAYLAERYERGLSEYTEDRELVAQGFLLPVLVGQVAPGHNRGTWEAPAREWVRRLSDAGFHNATTTHLHDFWWAPATAITAA